MCVLVNKEFMGVFCSRLSVMCRTWRIINIGGVSITN